MPVRGRAWRGVVARSHGVVFVPVLPRWPGRGADPVRYAMPSPDAPWARLVFAGWVPAAASAIARWRRRDGAA
ncbi:hypothetical protein [Amycolatopsis sp. CA-230715]|uniref:hypothetical protein n=1 Tax=Amycolatopsis sp. CA-230715 TaxID=2745196 RepID=UPI001C031143|nr:hypothetical protein [Amycolatopsis sp. CA-230715]